MSFIIPILFLLFSGCLQPQNELPIVPFVPVDSVSLEAMGSCSVDSDCVLVQEGCCSCSGGGENIAINDFFSDFYFENYLSNCVDVMCPAVFRLGCESEVADCVDGACVVSSGDIQVVDRVEGLVGCWHLDEGTELTMVDELGENDGIITGASWDSDGKFGYGLEFDGSSDFVEIGSNSVINASEGSISVWIKPNTVYLTKRQYVLWGGQSGGTGWGSQPELHLVITSGGNLQFTYHTSTYNVAVDSDLPISTTSWTHVVVTWGLGAENFKMYINGVLQENPATLPAPFDKSSWLDKIFIGRPDGTNPSIIRFDGKIDELKIFNRVLSGEGACVQGDADLCSCGSAA